MKAVADWLLDKGWRVPLVFVLMAIVPDESGRWLPLIAWIASTAVLALATMASGHGRGVQLAFTGALAVAVVGYVMQRVEPGVAYPDLESRLLLWVPALICAATVRRSGSLTLGVQTLLLIGLGALAVVFLLTDPYAYWIDRELGVDEARVATGLFVAAYVGFVAVAVLLAHAGARRADDASQGAGFSSLAMGQGLAVTSGVMFLVALAPSANYFANALLVLAVGFGFQGLAVASAWMEMRGLTGMWAVALYAAMLLAIMVTAPLMVGIGYIDNWLHLRRRWES
ncbi:MAG: hypothetical protein AAFX85_09690 [Pseudomonadota bacterium]